MEHRETDETSSTLSDRAKSDRAKRLITDIQKQHVLPDDADPIEAFAAVTCVLTQRLSGGEARHVFGGIPAGPRGLVETCVLHRDEPAAAFDLEDFLRRVADHLDVTPGMARRISGAVFVALRKQLSKEELAHVSSQLPADLRALWAPQPDEQIEVAGGSLGPPPLDAARLAVPPRDVKVAHPLFQAIEARVSLPPSVSGAGAFGAAVCLLTLRLTRGEALHVRASLPEQIRDVIFGCTQHRSEEAGRFTRSDFIAALAEQLETSPEHSELIARRVFEELRHYLPSPEVAHVATQLPKDLKELWLSSS
jgi:uncharacterized protein (DUF2267 family)